MVPNAGVMCGSGSYFLLQEIGEYKITLHSASIKEHYGPYLILQKFPIRNVPLCCENA